MSVELSRIDRVLPQRDSLPQTRLSSSVSNFYRALAGVVSWIWVALIAIVVLNVTMRYVLGEGRIEFEEIQWHLYAIGFLIGLATCMDSDNHVRVDVFHDRMSLRARSWIELYGLLLLFLPFAVSVFVFSIPFVTYSFANAEVSNSPGGLPYRWLIKSVLPLSMSLLILAGISRLSRVSACLFDWPAALDRQRSSNVDQ